MSLTSLDKADREREAEFLAETTPFEPDSKSIQSTDRTANIRMVSTDIEWYNKHQLFVATAKLDGVEYGALFDLRTKKGYVVKVIRVNGLLKDHRDLDHINEDEEWSVMSNYFSKQNVFDTNKIHHWLWNTRVTPELANGIPESVLRGGRR